MKRNKFSLSHYRLLSEKMGRLIPLTWYEALPGDTIQHSTAALIRLAPLLAPLMHPVKVRIHHWYVPIRKLWEDFEDFITGGDDGTSTPTHPYIALTTDLSSSEGHLLDHLGVPPVDYSAYNLNVNALPFRAYAFIYNEYYMDDQLETAIAWTDASGADSTTHSGTVASVCWEKDYYTTCRPYQDLGNDVTIPIQTNDIAPAFVVDGTDYDLTVNSASNTLRAGAATAGTTQAVEFGSETGLEVSIQDMRLATALNRFQEARNIYGSDYSEYLRYLGVRPSNRSLQKPLYLGGGVAPISFSPVVNVGQQDASNDIGDMKGAGAGAVKTKPWRYFCDEHGIVMTLMSVVPKSVYGTSIHRSFLREDKEDYYNKELELIGEQAVKLREVQSNHSNGLGNFGYQGRYDEYKSIPSGISGEFRSTNTDWHLARIFTANPTLNSSFINCSPDTTVFANTSADHMYIMASHSIQARRMMTMRRLSKTI